MSIFEEYGAFKGEVSRCLSPLPPSSHLYFTDHPKAFPLVQIFFVHASVISCMLLGLSSGQISDFSNRDKYFSLLYISNRIFGKVNYVKHF